MPHSLWKPGFQMEPLTGDNSSVSFKHEHLEWHESCIKPLATEPNLPQSPPWPDRRPAHWWPSWIGKCPPRCRAWGSAGWWSWWTGPCPGGRSCRPRARSGDLAASSGPPGDGHGEPRAHRGCTEPPGVFSLLYNLFGSDDWYWNGFVFPVEYLMESACHWESMWRWNKVRVTLMWRCSWRGSGGYYSLSQGES